MATLVKKKVIYGWHILPMTKKLRYDDDRKVRVGTKLSVTGNLMMCQNGLHASVSPGAAHFWWDKITSTFEPGYLCLVRLEREIYVNDIRSERHKWVARSRTVLAMKEFLVGEGAYGYPDNFNITLRKVAQEIKQKVGAITRGGRIVGIRKPKKRKKAA